jgi:hypothetical protein
MQNKNIQSTVKGTGMEYDQGGQVR